MVTVPEGEASIRVDLQRLLRLKQRDGRDVAHLAVEPNALFQSSIKQPIAALELFGLSVLPGAALAIAAAALLAGPKGIYGSQRISPIGAQPRLP